ADALVVVLRSHAATETKFPDRHLRLAPGTAQDGRQALGKDEPFIPPLPHPGRAELGIQRCNREFVIVEIIVGNYLARIAGVDFGQALSCRDPQFSWL